MSLEKDVVEIASIDDHFAGIDVNTFTQAVRIFHLQFPEYGFIHPSDLEPASTDLPDDDKLRLISILAELQWRITAPPTLSLVQCFLIMALYEWGEGIGYSAWMYAGIAARMAQVYRATKTDVNRPDQTLNVRANYPPLSEVEVRTMWTYFAIDKLLSCAKQRPASKCLSVSP
ncbi:hypothetical protein F5Y16DRAFT_45345 [Xylariaceae sp. FL0255]|nr:hypothetical protein F5Y16DRAFT_45345 [Xylariaceae sp. FL0255]